MNRAAAIRAAIQEQYPGAIVASRGDNFLHLLLPDGTVRAVITAGGGLHYDDGTGVMLETDTGLDDAEAGFTDGNDRMPWRFRATGGGTLTVWPRRNVVSEFIEYQAPQRRPLNLSQPYATITWDSRTRDGNVITWTRNNAQMIVTLGRTGMTLELVLLAASANGRILFPISLTGISRSGANLISASDGAVVGVLSPFVMRGANGVTRTAPATFVAAGVYIEPDTSGMTFPVRIT